MPSCRTQTPLQHLRPLKEERSLLLQRGQAVLTPVGLLSELWVTSVGHLYFAEGVTVSCCEEMAYYHCQSRGGRGNSSECQGLSSRTDTRSGSLTPMLIRILYITVRQVWLQHPLMSPFSVKQSRRVLNKDAVALRWHRRAEECEPYPCGLLMSRCQHSEILAEVKHTSSR